MYNFFFWFFYKYFEWKDKTDLSFTPSSIVVLIINIHLGFIYSVYIYLYGERLISQDNLPYYYSKLLIAPFIFSAFFLIWYFYYRRKKEEILKKYEGRKVFTVKNIIIVLFFTVLPLIFIIRLNTVD